MPLHHLRPQSENGETEPHLSEAKIDLNSIGDNTLVSAVASQTIRLYKIQFIVAADVDIIFKDGSTALTGLMTLFAGGSYILDFDKEPWYTTSSGSALVLNLSAAVQVSGRLHFVQS